jgi:hypothetical protein
MGCFKANTRLKERVVPVMRGESLHPAHEHIERGIEHAKAMYARVYRKAR